MNKTIILIVLFLLCFTTIYSQNIIIGIVVDNNSESPLSNVFVRVKNTNVITKSDINGFFQLKDLSNGSCVLEIKFNGFETQNFPIELSGKTLDLGSIILYKDITEEQDLSIITITDDELNNDASAADNISGLLHASKDIFLRTAAFEFSSSFFRIKGLDSGNGKVLINGIEISVPINLA